MTVNDGDRTKEQGSGQFRLRIPRDLHGDLAREARSQGVSLNSYVMYLLSFRHSREMAWQEAASYYAERLQDTMREVHDMVHSMTVGDVEPEAFTWRNTGSSSFLTQ